MNIGKFCPLPLCTLIGYFCIYLWQQGHLSLHFFYPEYFKFSINFWRMLGSGQKTCGWGNLKIFFWKSASGWGNVKNFIFGCASGWGNAKNCIFGCASGWGNANNRVSGCASGWGNVQIKKWNVLLAGEKLKKKMKCASGWGNVFFLYVCFWLGKF